MNELTAPTDPRLNAVLAALTGIEIDFEALSGNSMCPESISWGIDCPLCEIGESAWRGPSSTESVEGMWRRVLFGFQRQAAAKACPHWRAYLRITADPEAMAGLQRALLLARESAAPPGNERSEDAQDTAP